jgi:hypothetical protein
VISYDHNQIIALLAFWIQLADQFSQLPLDAVPYNGLADFAAGHKAIRLYPENRQLVHNQYLPGILLPFL